MCFRLGWLLLLATATGRRVVPALLLARAAAQKVVPIPRAQTLQVAGPVDEPTSIELTARRPRTARPSSRSSSSRGPFYRGRRRAADHKSGSDAPDGVHSSGQNIPSINLTAPGAVGRSFEKPSRHGM